MVQELDQVYSSYRREDIMNKGGLYKAFVGQTLNTELLNAIILASLVRKLSVLKHETSKLYANELKLFLVAITSILLLHFFSLS